MSDFWLSMLQSGARHILTGFAVYLVSHGLIDQSAGDAIVAGGLALAAAVWSWYDKAGRAEIAARLKRFSGAQAMGKASIALIAFILLLPASGHAADMATKAIRAQAAASVFSGYPTSSGFYFGLNSALSTGKANEVAATTAAANAGSLVTQQGELGLTVGYTWGMQGKPVWFAGEGTFDFSNINASNAGPLNGGTFSLSGPADFEQVFLMGAPWATVTSALPNLNLQFPTLTPPPGLTGSTPNLYLFAGIYEQDVSSNFGLATGKQWLVGLTSGLGARALLSNAAALDVRFEYRSPTQSQCVSGFQVVSGCAGLGSQYMARTAILF